MPNASLQEEIKEFLRVIGFKDINDVDKYGNGIGYYVLRYNRKDIIDYLFEVGKKESLEKMLKNEEYKNFFERKNNNGVLPVDLATVIGDSSYDAIEKVVKEYGFFRVADFDITELFFGSEEQAAFAVYDMWKVDREELKKYYNIKDDEVKLVEATYNLSRHQQSPEIVKTIREYGYGPSYIGWNRALLATAIEHLEEDENGKNRQVYKFLVDVMKCNPPNSYSIPILYGSTPLLGKNALQAAIDSNDKKIFDQVLELDKEGEFLKESKYNHCRFTLSPKSDKQKSNVISLPYGYDCYDANILAYTLATCKNPDIIRDVVNKTKNSGMIKQEFTLNREQTIGKEQKKFTTFDLLYYRYSHAQTPEEKAFFMRAATGYAKRDMSLVSNLEGKSPELQNFYVDVIENCVEQNDDLIKSLPKIYKEYVKTTSEAKKLLTQQEIARNFPQFNGREIDKDLISDIEKYWKSTRKEFESFAKSVRKENKRKVGDEWI